MSSHLKDAPPEIHGHVADDPLLKPWDASSMFTAMVKPVNSPKLTSMHKDITDFIKQMGEPSDKLETFERLIDRLHHANRRLKGIPSAVNFTQITTTVYKAVSAAYKANIIKGDPAGTNIKQRDLCIKVLKAVFSRAINVEVKRVDDCNVDVSMDTDKTVGLAGGGAAMPRQYIWQVPLLEPDGGQSRRVNPRERVRLPERTPGRARFRITYFNNKAEKKSFQSLEVYADSRDRDYSLRIELGPKGQFFSPSFFIANVAQATPSQLLDWPAKSIHVELAPTKRDDVIKLLTQLIMQSGIFSDLGTSTVCRASFTDSAL